MHVQIVGVLPHNSAHPTLKLLVNPEKSVLCGKIDDVFLNCGRFGPFLSLLKHLVCMMHKWHVHTKVM
jgi:hypothetical protein